ncbi:hypothetical protein [Pedobacter sp. SYP-B3415]|uniref:hypothetical protein n=1 Tax=Pedobacter sp. SYP-B3415 TaxID=2496641 RepID=UPI00101D0A1F|nr:hypothetical protein [Pedobacter sp. SYP-B3415]
MKHTSLWLCIFLMCASNVRAQTLQTIVDKIKSIRSAGCTEVVKFKLSFQDDYSIDTFNTQVAVVPSEMQMGGYYYIQGKNDTYLFDGTKAVWLNLRDSTYKINSKAVGGQYTRSLLY